MRKQLKILTLIFGALWLTSTTTTQSFEWSDWQRYATFCSMPIMPMLPQFVTDPLQHLAEFFDTKAMSFLAGGALLGGIAVYVWQQMTIKKINEKNTKLNEKLRKELTSLRDTKEKIEEAYKNLKTIFESLMDYIRQLIAQENPNTFNNPPSSFQKKFKQFKQDINLISHVFQKNKNLEKELKALEKNHQERIFALEEQILPRFSDEYYVGVLNNQILFSIECNKNLEKTIDELKKKITQLEISKQTNEKAWDKTVMDFVEARRPKPPLLTNEVKKRRTI